PSLERALIAEYEAVCDKQPPAKDGYFSEIAQWAAKSRIAARERERQRMPTEPRELVVKAMGLAPGVGVVEVVSFGRGMQDPLHIRLSSGHWIKFDAQAEVTLPRTWQNVIAAATDGAARP